MAKKLEAELGLNNKGFLQGLSEAEGMVGKFGRTLGMLSIGLAAAAGAFKILLDWTKETDWGMRALNVTIAVSKQLLTDMLTGEGLHIKEAIKNAKAQSKINEDNAKEGYIVAKMSRELHELEVQAADQTLTLAQKKEILIKAMEKEREIKEYLIADAKEELKVAWDFYKINQGNTKARVAFFNAAKRLEEVQGQDSRRLLSQYTGVLKQEADAADEAAKAIQEMADSIKALAPVLNFTSTGGMSGVKGAMSKLAKDALTSDNFAMMPAPQINWDLMGHTMFEGFDQAAQWQGIWENAIMSVTDQMTEAFSTVFKAIGSGDWENVGKDILGSFGGFISNLGKMLVAYGVMKSAFFKSLTAGPAGAAIAIGAGIAAIALGALFQGAASRGTGAMSSGGGGGGYGGQSSSNMQTIKVQVEGSIKGKDIFIANRRYLEDN